jgi:hypothetical protein
MISIPGDQLRSFSVSTVVNFVAFKTCRQNNDEGAPYRVIRITAKPNCFSMKCDSIVDGTLPECATALSISCVLSVWRSGREVECGGLEIR